VLGVDENKKARSGKTPSSQMTIKEEDDIAEQIQTGLTKLFGLQGAPRSPGQAEALQVILRRPKTSIVVLPIDGGKFLLHILPAILSSSGTVIVVVPYVELLDHLLVRATKQGLDCIRWHYNQMDQASHQLVLVSADLAVSELFIEYASQLKNLKHVFFDEAHCAYIETSFRERLTKL
jgi:superfamily II DNA helicase RecQ